MLGLSKVVHDVVVRVVETNTVVPVVATVNFAPLRFDEPVVRKFKDVSEMYGQISNGLDVLCRAQSYGCVDIENTVKIHRVCVVRVDETGL